jgi:hypothetical protein
VTRLRFSDLDEARRDPRAFRRKLGAGATQAGFGPSYFSTLRDALFRYHSHNRDVQDASAYLERRLSRFKDDSSRERYMDHFFWYVNEYDALGWPTFRIKQRVTIPLPHARSPDSTCSGEVSRLDIVPTDGFAAWLFRKDADPDWRNQLHLRLLQDSVARAVLHTQTQQVRIGIYAFEARQAYSTTFSPDDIQDAFRELAHLIAILGL